MSAVQIELPQSPSRALPAAQAWGVAWTRARCEKYLADFFADRHIPCFLPTVQKRRVYGARVRVSELPLFSGYVFYDHAQIARRDVLASGKVAEILLPDDTLTLARELNALHTALQVDPALRESRYGQVGQPVTVARGPLKGVIGELVRLDGGSRLVIRVSFLGKAAELEIDEAFIEPDR